MVERRSPKPNVAGSSPAWPVLAGMLRVWYLPVSLSFLRFFAGLRKKNTNNRWTGMAKIVQFVKECVAELRKVVWPTRENVISSVKVVVVSTAIIAVLLGFLDAVFMAGVNLVF